MEGKESVSEVEIEKAELVSWLEYKQIQDSGKKVILLGYLDGQVEILCFYSKKTLYRSEPTGDGIVKGIFFTMKDSNAFVGSFHVREDSTEEPGFEGPEYYILNQHLLSYENENDLFTTTLSQSLNLHHGSMVWNRRELSLWHATTLLNDDKLLAYNGIREGKRRVVVVMDIERSLFEGKFQEGVVLDTDMEAVKICYYSERNAVIVVGNSRDKNVVQKWERDESGQYVLS